MALESFLKYYQQELEFLVEGGKTFSKKYPNIAQSLDFSSFSSNDPDVKRLIESIAFLNAKLQRRLDEQTPEISTEILNAIYPQFVSPIPACCIMNFTTIAKPNTGAKFLPKNTTLNSMNEFDKQFYIFNTTMDIEISPWEILDIELAKASSFALPTHIKSIADNALKISLDHVSPYTTDSLTFYIHMIDDLAHDFYKAIMSVHPDKNTPIFENGIKIGEIEPVGFDESQSLFPHSKRENPAYAAIVEYNVFPKKFLFFKTKFSKLPEKEIVIPINSKKEFSIRAENLLLNCTPAINLFEKTSEPIAITNKNISYRISADFNKQKAIEIHTILELIDTNFASTTKYVPYYSHQHIMQTEENTVFWNSKRQIHKNLQTGSQTFISFLNTQPANTKILYAKLRCSQRRCNELIPALEKWSIANTPGNLECTNIDRPTAFHEPVLDSHTQWRLISHLAINYFGFEGNEGIEHLKELFTIYNVSNTNNKNALLALKSMDYKMKMAAYQNASVPKACIELNVDENTCSTFLLGQIIGSFFSKMVGLNTQLELALKKHSNDEVWKVWQLI